MARIGEPILVVNPPPLPANGEVSASGAAARGPKIGSKGHSRLRAREVSGGGMIPTSSRARSGESDSAPSSERASDVLNREGSFDSEADENRNNRRTLTSPIDLGSSGEQPYSSVNGTSAPPLVIHGSGGPPKAVRRLRDTSSTGMRIPPF